MWFRGGQTVGTGRTLSFPVFRNQSGYYLCVADNDLNVTVDASAYLEVHCKFKSVIGYSSINQSINLLFKHVTPRSTKCLLKRVRVHVHVQGCVDTCMISYFILLTCLEKTW